MTKHRETIINAVKRGYTFDFDTCQLITPSGTRYIPKLYGKQRYPSYTINSLIGIKNNVSFNIHKFVAYLLYGDASFADGVNVRHLDGNTLNLSKENIVLGSSQENQFDKPQDVRSRAAIKARMSQGIRPVTSIIKDEEARKILTEYLTLKGEDKRAKRGLVKSLILKYGYSKSSIQAICSGYSFKDIYEQVVSKLNGGINESI